MSKQAFFQLLKKEVARIDAIKTSKRNETVITGFTKDTPPRAIINKKRVLVFNSNDYLGLRFHPKLIAAEHQASEKFGTGPGAVRFISGTLAVHKELEKSLAQFHRRDDAIIFSSAFATNVATLFSLIVGQSKDSVVDNDVLVISDALNHRSIIDGIRIANLASESKAIFEHMNPKDLERILKENIGKYKRVIAITDGVFSMLGEIQKLKEIKKVITHYDKLYPQGVLLVVDDAHGIGALGVNGTGSEEVTDVQADVLIGTLGKALGADGGYVVANQEIIDYLRESAATYIYSNSISPGTAAAATAAIDLLSKKQGKELITKLNTNISYFKSLVKEHSLQMAADSSHPIQPLLIGSAEKCQALVKALLLKNILVTSINYPVVAKGNDEIRIQLSANHTKDNIFELVSALVRLRDEIKF